MAGSVASSTDDDQSLDSSSTAQQLKVMKIKLFSFYYVW